MATRLGGPFDRLSIAAGVSNLGDGVFTAAFPLLIATLTRDPIVVAGVTLAGRLPWFLLGVVAGALVDRTDRRRVILTGNGIRGVGVGLLGAAVATDRVDVLTIYLVAFGLGVAETFVDTSTEALVPALVPSAALPAANARLQVLEHLANAFVGPVLGAFLFAWLALAPFAFNTMTYALAIGCVVTIAGRYRAERTGPATSLGHDIVSGMRWLWRQRVVRTLALMAGTINLAVFAVVATFVLFAQDVLGVAEAGYGVLLATLGLGGIAGAILAPRVVARLGPGTSLRVTLVGQAAALAVFSQQSEPVPAGALMAAYGALTSIWNVVAVSLRQRLTPDALRGRVAGAARTLAWGTQPLGAAVGGVIALWLGLRAPVVFAAATVALGGMLAWRVLANDTLAGAQPG